MKTYKIKSNDFSTLEKVENVKNKNTLEQVKSVEKSTGEKILKVMTKGTKGNSVLMIGESGKYYITARPCYIESLEYWLSAVGIEPDNIITLKKSTAPVELSLEKLKELLLN